MAPLRASKNSTVKAVRRRVAGELAAGDRVPVRSIDFKPCPEAGRGGAVASPRCSQAVRVAGGGPSVGACRAARKPLAALGLGLLAALRVRSGPAVGAGLRLASHPTRPKGQRRTP